jgi:hypothetical protein
MRSVADGTLFDGRYFQGNLIQLCHYLLKSHFFLLALPIEYSVDVEVRRGAAPQTGNAGTESDSLPCQDAGTASFCCFRQWSRGSLQRVPGWRGGKTNPGLSASDYEKVYFMSRPVIDILLDTLQELEQSTDCQLDEPVLTKLRDEIAKTIITLHLANDSHSNLVPAPTQAA